MGDKVKIDPETGHPMSDEGEEDEYDLTCFDWYEKKMMATSLHTSLSMNARYARRLYDDITDLIDHVEDEGEKEYLNEISSNVLKASGLMNSATNMMKSFADKCKEDDDRKFSVGDKVVDYKGRIGEVKRIYGPLRPYEVEFEGSKNWYWENELKEF